MINVEGRLNKKFKMNLSFHKRGMQGAKYYRLQQLADSQLYQMFIPSIMTQDKTIDVKDVYPDTLREKVQEYLTDNKNKELAFSNLNENNKTSEKPTSASLNEQESRMEAIMALVNSTSKSVEIYRQLINISGVLVFTQLIHNTDKDMLTLLLITDYDTYEIREITFSNHIFTDIALLRQRCGTSTNRCLMQATTIFMSFEFESIIRHFALNPEAAPTN